MCEDAHRAPFVAISLAGVAETKRGATKAEAAEALAQGRWKLSAVCPRRTSHR
jgi:hypothetical protein